MELTDSCLVTSKMSRIVIFCIIQSLICSVNSAVLEWSAWSACSKPCEMGLKTRSRCILPAPANSGYDCFGISAEDLHTFCYNAMCPESERPCPQVIDSYGTWPTSAVGQVVVIDCADNYHVGNYSRKCTYYGVWDEVIVQCWLNKTKLDDLSNLVNNISNSPEKAPAVVEGVSRDLVELTSRVGLTADSSYFNNVINVISNVTGVVENNRNITDNAVENIIEAVSNTIQPGAEKAWTDKNTNVVGSEILNTVDRLTAVLLNGKCQTLPEGALKDINKSYIYTEIGKTSDNVLFPSAKDTGSSIHISEAALSNKGINEVCFSGTYYNTVAEIIENVSSNGTSGQVGSDVISIQLPSLPNVTVTGFNPPISITLSLKNTTASNITCVAWDFNKTSISKNGAWSTEGCVLVKVTSSSAVCECTHLTNFAILTSPYAIAEAHSKALGIISAVGCAVSMAGLVLTIVAYSLVWRLVRSDRAIVLMNLCVSLFLALGMFLVGVDRTESRVACVIIAALIQIFFLAMFASMLVMGLEILVCVHHVFRNRFRIKILIPLAWIAPVVIVGVSLAITNTDGYGNDKFCWLDIESGLIWSFIGPIAVVILVNFIIVVIVFKKMFTSFFVKSKSKQSQIKTALRSICVLLPVMGLTWVLGIVAVNSDTVIVQFLFSIFNSLQGFLIFLFHCVLNTQIRSALKHIRDRKRSLQTFSSDIRKQSSRSKSLSKEEKLLNNFTADTKPKY